MQKMRRVIGIRELELDNFIVAHLSGVLEDQFHGQLEWPVSGLIDDGIRNSLKNHLSALTGAMHLPPRDQHQIVASSKVIEPAAIGMTIQEKRAMDHLVDFWNAYVALPDTAGAETTRTIADAVHIIQGVLAIRVAKRANPEIWS